MRKIEVLIVLFATSLLTSMAAMEIFAWLLFAISLGLVLAKSVPLKNYLIPSMLVTACLGVFFVVLVAGVAAWSPGWAKATDVIGWSRWIVLLYMWGFLWRSLLNKNWERGLKIWMIVVAIVGLYSLVQFFFGVEIARSRTILSPRGDFWRASGFFNLSLTFAYSIGMAGMIALGCALVTWKDRLTKENLLYIAAFVFAALGVFASLTRGAWIAYVISSLLLVLLTRPKLAWVVPAGALVVGGLAFLADPALRFRIMSIGDMNMSSNIARLGLWKSYWAMFLDQPFIGVGLGHGKELLSEYLPKVGHVDNGFRSHAHNNFIHILGSMGGLGLLSFVGFCGYFIWLNVALVRRKASLPPWSRGLALGILGAQVYFHIGGLTEASFIDGEVNHQLIFWWGALLGLANRPLAVEKI